MLIIIAVISSLIAATSVSITEPIDGGTYDGDWLPFRVIVENENEIPDSVHYTLNENPVTCIPRLNTDWPTYMQNFQNNGFSESPAPMTSSVLWAAPVTGEVHEFPTPVTYEGMVFYTSDSIGMAETDTLYALDAATGSVIWKYDTGYADDAVTVVDGRVYSSADSIFCLDAYTGGLIWVNGIGNQPGGSPVVANGRVYCGVFKLGTSPPYNDHCRVACLDALDGSVLWADTVLGNQASCMGFYQGTIVLPTHDGPLYGINAETGDVLWTNDDCPDGYWDSSPNIVDGVIYIGDEGFQGEAFIRAVDIQTGETIWEQQTSSCITATPAYNGERLFYGDYQPNFYCLDATTGSEIWSNPIACIHGSPGATEDLVYFGEDNFPADDSARVIALDSDIGDVVWTFTTSAGLYGGFQSSPSITDGVMYYACTDGYLYAFGTGLKYTYREDDFYADIGYNELIVTSWDNGVAVAADTINFTVTQTGITLEPSKRLNLCAVPNPMQTTTCVTFSLEEPRMVSLKVFDLSGREITTLVDQQVDSGDHFMNWNGCDTQGHQVSSGLYLFRIESGGVVETTGLCVLR